ncbi:MAG TPA: hypothetical protein VKR31_08480 [Rhizomicrobium sp.]|nr:hypothetical protein [Rhizomicrobium sp.]
MKSRMLLTAGASALAIASLFLAAADAAAHPIYVPVRPGFTPQDPNAPTVHVGPVERPYIAPGTKSGKWTDLKSNPFKGEGGWGPLLLTDGTVMMKQAFTGTAGVWYKLTPSKTGSYVAGKWTQLAAMPAGYSPDFNAQQVLTDGRVLIEGGEYNDQCGGGCWTNKGALYDPVKDSWTSVNPPTGWSQIGDAESVILPDGTYMLASCCARTTGKYALASISGTTVTWTSYNGFTCPSGDPCFDEDGFTSLPNGDVLLVDVWNHTSTSDNYYVYDTASNSWSLGGTTPDYLSTTSTFELGATPLTPQYGKQGTIIQLTGTGNPGVSDVYDVASGKWTSGPTLKVGGTTYFMADAPAAVLPDGNVFLSASPGYGNVTPEHFWEMSISKTGAVKATQVNDNTSAPHSNSFTNNMLLLPTGQVLWDDSQFSTEVAVYTPKGKPKAAWLPVVSSVKSSLKVGSTGNAISGTNFNGFTLGGFYGDDAQAATNYPIVRITNNATSDVCYARSYNFSTMGVWTSGTTNATFDVPKSCETGASSLQVIVNGIASSGTAVTLS